VAPGGGAAGTVRPGQRDHAQLLPGRVDELRDLMILNRSGASYRPDFMIVNRLRQ
jgi:hypothetical protein